MKKKFFYGTRSRSGRPPIYARRMIFVFRRPKLTASMFLLALLFVFFSSLSFYLWEGRVLFLLYLSLSLSLCLYSFIMLRTGPRRGTESNALHWKESGTFYQTLHGGPALKDNCT
ncbi:Acyl-CoA desaturase [Fusarium oxysporum f. sp. albedinis]|nr:Acyl-CoA desaturase [Fusarium oxysporum f. sp. albedinis]